MNAVRIADILLRIYSYMRQKEKISIEEKKKTFESQFNNATKKTDIQK